MKPWLITVKYGMLIIHEKFAPELLCIDVLNKVVEVFSLKDSEELALYFEPEVKKIIVEISLKFC